MDKGELVPCAIECRDSFSNNVWLDLLTHNLDEATVCVGPMVHIEKIPTRETEPMSLYRPIKSETYSLLSLLSIVI